MDKYQSTKPAAKTKSPRREAINKQLDQHTTRIKQLMQQDYILLEQENSRLKLKCMKFAELEEKVELVMRSNGELFVENQKLAKLVEDKLDQCEILKRKLESTKRANEGMNQYERKKLLLEIERLQKQIQQIEHLKNITIKQIKSKHLIELESLRKDHETGIKLYDEQLIKLKEQADKKELEVGVLEVKLRKCESDGQFEISQGKEERGRLKEEVKRLEPYVKMYEKEREDNERLLAEKKKDEETSQARIKQLTQKSRQELDQCRNELRTCKQTLEQQNLALQTKNKRLQKKLEQLQQKLQQLRKQKQQSESSEKNLRRQLQSQKHKIKQLTLINTKQFQTLQQKYQSLRTQQLSQLQASHENYRSIAESEIQKLSDIIRLKEEELLYLSEEKSRMKQVFIEEGNQMKNQLVLLREEFRDSQACYREEIGRLEDMWVGKLKACQGELMAKLRKGDQDAYIKMRKLEDQCATKLKKVQSESNAQKNRLESQLITLDKQKRKLQEQHSKKSTQITAYKEIVESQKEDIKQLTRKAEQREKIYKKSEEELKNIVNASKSRIEKIQEEYERYRVESAKGLQEKESQFRGRLKEKEKAIDKLERENQSIKEFIANRDKSLGQLNEKIESLSREIEQRNEIIDQLRSQIIEIAQKNSTKLASQKSALHSHYQTKIKLLTQDFTTRTTILETQVQSLSSKLSTKQSQLEQLLKQYKKMRQEMIVLTEQDANKRDITLKFAGATADLIASKNMFDVFVKGKVLELCADVVGKGVTGDGKENVDQ